MYRVYELFNIMTGQTYIGMTGRDLETRKAEHMLSATENSTREIVKAIRKHPESDSWAITQRYITPLYPEACMMEKAMIKVVAENHVILNTAIPEIDHGPTLDAAKYIFKHGSYPPPDMMTWNWANHGDHPDVYIYKLKEDQYWRYGYRGRGNTDTDKLWKEYYSQHTDFNKAHFEAAQHFEMFNAEDILATEFQPSDKRTPLQSLVTVQNVLNDTQFLTQEEVEHFFTIVNGMKATL